MSRERILLLIDRVPRYASLAGLLGLIGVAGVFDPGLFRFSALSSLSYFSFFRFFRCFIAADYGPRASEPPIAMVWFMVMVLGVGFVLPLLVPISPIFGFLGFAGTLGLYDPPHIAGHRTTA